MSINLITILVLSVFAVANIILYLFFPKQRKFAAVSSRIFVGLVFMFSGFVKAVDPLGSEYKITDYLTAFGLNMFQPASIYFAVLLNILEFSIGFVLFFGVKMRLFSWGSLLFMIFFTPLTLYLAIKNPVSDCGCFGDFIVFTNWETFYKNLVFLSSALIVHSYRKRYFERLIPGWFKNFIVAIGIFIALAIQLYAIRYDAIFDFRPWKIGNNIAELVVPKPEKAEITLIYKNKTTQAQEEFTSKTLPWEDTVRMANLEFIDQKKKIIEPYQDAPIHDFIIRDHTNDDLTNYYISKPEYHFFLIAYDLSKTNRSSYEKIKKFAERANLDSISFVAISGSTPKEVEKFINEIKPNFQILSADPTALKTIIRSNPALLLLKNGYIIDKWPHRKIPHYNKFKEKINYYDKLYNKFVEKHETK